MFTRHANNLLVGLALCMLPLPALAQTSGPAIAVDTQAAQHAISPYIYGMASYGVDPTYQAAARLAVLRWGGDGTTRYNWQVDSSNAGFDWYFMGGDGNANPVASAGPDALVNADRATKSATLLTIPIIPWINAGSAWTCSFPTSVYGAQQSVNPYVHPNGEDCGNSIASPSGAQLTDTDITANNTANAPALQEAWVQHLVAAFGRASKGGVKFYQLDNEPFGWSNTHRDVMPSGTTTYSVAPAAGQQSITLLGHSYAAAVKHADPSAQILGPSDFTLGGWIGSPGEQSNLYAAQYYLQQMAALDAPSGHRTLDYFDEHYYFNFTDPTSQLASTRTLWDSTYNGGTWVEQYYFDGPMMLIPRFRQWIAQYYPATKLAISEYSIDSGNKLITDALAEADVLGIFGREQVGLATMWNPPAPADPIAFSFLLYRNYNGNGLGFGATSVQTTSADQSSLSAYGALRTPNLLTLVLINKTTTDLTTPISIANQTATVHATLFSYSGADLAAFHHLPSVTFQAGTATITVPAYSMNMLAVPVQ